MYDLLPDLLPEIAAQHLPGLDLGPNTIYPAYHGLSLLNLPASICQWLGAPPLGARPLQPKLHSALQAGSQYQNVILILVDGLGLNWFEGIRRSHPALARVWDDLLANSILAPLTSVTPSTTATALTSLWSGASPAEHGILGYEIWLKEYGVVANMIYHTAITFHGDYNGLQRAGFDPQTFLHVPTLGPHMRRHNIHPYALQHRAFSYSGLSQMHLKDVTIIGCRTLEDQWYNLLTIMGQKQEQNRYLYLYWSILDELCHAYGVNDPRVAQDFLSFSRSLADFLQILQSEKRQDTLVLLTADHGHLPTPPDSHFELQNHPDLMDCLTIKPTSENRLPYLFVKPGREEKMLAYIKQQWPGLFKLFPAEQALNAGLFGSNGCDPRSAERLGNWLVVPQDDAYWWWADEKNPMLGRHGGVSPQEMLVPLVAWKV